jgi:tRNA-specific 2-thiouridylase
VTRKCVALFSGGLDSMLAVRLVQQQDIAVEAVTFKTIYTCCDDNAGRAASFLEVPLTVMRQEDDYLDVIRQPRFGYGRGANPCVDCRIYMFRRAAAFARAGGADFVISGEVLGQRPMSQKRRDLEVIAYHSGLEGLLLRPLSAMLMQPTLPEVSGWVDRRQLGAYHGRGRKGLIRLARRLGFPYIPSPSTGCALTEPQFARNVFDLIDLDPDAERWDFELLRVGRHYRHDRQTKVVVGRRQTENEALEYLHGLPDARSSALIMPENFVGPAALMIGPPNPQAVAFAAGLVWRHGRRDIQTSPLVRVEGRDESYITGVETSDAVKSARTLASMGT